MVTIGRRSEGAVGRHNEFHKLSAAHARHANIVPINLTSFAIRNLLEILTFRHEGSPTCSRIMLLHMIKLGKYYFCLWYGRSLLESNGVRANFLK